MPGRCCLCELQKRSYVCPSCFHDSLGSRRHDVAVLSEERDGHLQQLEGALALKEEEQQRAAQLVRLQEGVRESRQRVAELEQRLLAIRRRTAEVRQQNLERQARLREAGHQMGRWMQQAHRESAGQLEALGQNYLRSLDMLTREQRSKVVRRVLEILPVKLMAPGHSGRGQRGGAGATAPEEERAVVMICGLLLPDSRDDIGELVQLLPQLGSSLGYVALLLDVLSRFLQLPLLHRLSFQASTSSLWQPAGFFDLRAAPPPGALPLFPPDHPHHHGGGSGGGGGLEGLYSAVAGMAAGGGNPAAAEAAAARGRARLQQALHGLQRSAGALVYARLGPDAHLKVPTDWAPLAVLGGLCKMLAAEAQRGPLPPHHPAAASRAAAAAAAAQYHHHTRAAGASGLAASAVFGRLPAQQDALGQSMMWPDEDGGEEEWDIIPRPSYGRMIPPPPSQPDDVEHWTQAMYPGRVPQQQAQQQGAQQAQQAPPAAAGSSPVERVYALAGALRTYMAGS